MVLLGIAVVGLLYGTGYWFVGAEDTDTEHLEESLNFGGTKCGSSLSGSISYSFSPEPFTVSADIGDVKAEGDKFTHGTLSYIGKLDDKELSITASDLSNITCTKRNQDILIAASGNGRYKTETNGEPLTVLVEVSWTEATVESVDNTFALKAFGLNDDGTKGELVFGSGEAFDGSIVVLDTANITSSLPTEEELERIEQEPQQQNWFNR